MANAAILKYGTVVRTSLFTEQKFSLDGFLSEFVISGIKYKHVFKDDFRKEDFDNDLSSGGYYKLDDFLEYLSGLISLEQIAKSKLMSTDLEYAINGDVVFVQRLKIEAPYTDFCVVERITWILDSNIDVLDDDFNIQVPAPPLSSITTHNILVEQIAKDFYNHKFHLFINGVQDSDEQKLKAYIIAQIALYINNIIVDIYLPNYYDEQFSSYIDSQLSYWTDSPMFINPSVKDLNDYLFFLSRFYNITFSNSLFILEADGDAKLYYLAYSLTPDALSVIPVSNRINLLYFIGKGNIRGEIAKYFTGQLDQELFVLNIIKSVGMQDATLFLDGLINLTIEIDRNKYMTLFERLYSEVDDKILSFGLENRFNLMTLLYRLWYASSYNPIIVYDFNNTNLTETQDLADSYVNTPIFLDYNSTKVFGFYIDDYDFVFKNSRIEVRKDVEKTIAVSPTYGNDFSTTKIVTIKEVVGSYNFYQAITLKDIKNHNYAITIPEISIENSTAYLPLFFIKYMDDYGSNENLFTGIGLAFDVALTFTGIGNLSKLRYLKYTTKLGRLALGQASVGESILALQALNATAGVVELTSSIASIILTAYTDGCSMYINQVNQTINDNNPNGYLPDCEEVTSENEDYCYCRNLDKWLFWVQIASASTDFISRTMVRNASRKLIQDGVPVGFNSDAYDIILKFAGDLSEIKVIFSAKVNTVLGPNSKLLDDLEALSETEQYQFLLQFNKATDNEILALGETILDDNGIQRSLVKEWSNTQHLKRYRSISFLSSLRWINNDPRLTIHIHRGHAGVSGSNAAYVTGVHNLDALIYPDIDGIVRYRWVNEDAVFINGRGYRSGYIERDMSDFNWTGGNPPSTWRMKNDLTTFWPENFNVSRINEEMALALSNKKLKKSRLNRDGTISSYYRGKASDGQRIEIVINTNTNLITSIYPII